MNTLTAPSAHTTDLNDQTTHVICCNWDIALCGLDVSDHRLVADSTGHDCIVCLDLEEQPCPRCDAQNRTTA